MDVVGRLIPASRLFALADAAAEHRPPRNEHALGQAAFVQVRLHLNDRHRRSRGDEMGVHDLEQVLRDLRILRIELELDPRRKERQSLQQTFHVGIGALESFQPQSPRDLGELTGEFGPHLAHVLQLAMVVFAQSWIHGIPPPIKRGQAPSHTSIPVVSRTIAGSSPRFTATARTAAIFPLGPSPDRPRSLTTAAWATVETKVFPSISKMSEREVIWVSSTMAFTLRLSGRIRGSKSTIACCNDSSNSERSLPVIFRPAKSGVP